MLILLSPAKDLADSTPSVKNATQPALLEHSPALVGKLRTLSAKKLGALMHISPKLAVLNHARYQEWDVPFTPKNASPAAFLFNGEAYRGLDVRSLEPDDLRFAQLHLRILSGLYGVLRPLDLVQPYRLEMGTKLKVGKAKDLYAYWGSRITERLQADLKASGGKAIINAASTEYFKAVRTEELDVPVITPVFKDLSGNGYRMLMVYAKHQRGALARYMIQHRTMEPAALKKYTGDGYRFSAAESTATEWMFLRDVNPK